MNKLLAFGLALVLAQPIAATAAVLYSTPAEPYRQNFNDLPTNVPNHGNLETVYSTGWRDNVDPATTPEDDISLPGWYLYHPHWNAAFTDGEGGFNEHQRLRMGDGSSSTGAFWLWGAGGASDPEKALGPLVTDHLADPPTNKTGRSNFDEIEIEQVHMALRITNNSQQRLRRLRISYAVEQWRNGVADPNMAEEISMGVLQSNSLSELAFGGIGVDNWFAINDALVSHGARFTKSPIVGMDNAATDGNGAGRVLVTSEFVSITPWDPGDDIWIRWSKSNDFGPDDGLAIDDVEFIAYIPEPASACLMLTALGAFAQVRRMGRARR